MALICRNISCDSLTGAMLRLPTMSALCSSYMGVTLVALASISEKDSSDHERLNALMHRDNWSNVI